MADEWTQEDVGIIEYDPDPPEEEGRGEIDDPLLILDLEEE